MSMTFDCWKNSCHGATVVPTMLMISSSAVPSKPPRTEGTTLSWTTMPISGWTISVSGMATRLTTMKPYMKRSQRRKLPVMVTAISATAATGTEINGLIPK